MSMPVPAAGLTLPGVPPGVYYVRLRARNQAGTSPPSDWERLVVGGAEPRAPSDTVAWITGDRLVTTWSRGANGEAVIDYVLEVGSATGRSDIARLPVTTNFFTFAPVPPGVYFLRVRARNAQGLSAPGPERLINVGHGAAPPRRPGVMLSTVLGSTVSLSWEASAGGADGYVLEAGTSEGLADIGRFDIGAATTFSASGVPPGNYFVRVRGRNAQGLGLPSRDSYVFVR
jgi:hypothetical protein